VIPAVVLTAGLATRLRPLSLVRAKAALPVAGRPLVCHILERLRDAGVADAVLNLHHLPETITGRVGDGTALGIRVRYSWERVVLGSAGGPRRAAPLVGTPTFLIVNGDTLASVDIRGLVDHHRASGALVTMAVTPNDDPLKYGGVAATPDGVVTGFVRRGDRSASQHFVGVQVVQADAFRTVPADVPWDSVGALYPALIAGAPGSVRAFPGRGDFHDIGTPLDYLMAARRLDHNGSSTPSAPHPGQVVDSVLWDAVTIGAGASVTRCIVTDGVDVPAGSTWIEQTLRRADGPPAGPAETRIGAIIAGPLVPSPRG
jgi:mannose-1-phosphate guanylyltransferase